MIISSASLTIRNTTQKNSIGHSTVRWYGQIFRKIRCDDVTAGKKYRIRMQKRGGSFAQNVAQKWTVEWFTTMSEFADAINLPYNTVNQRIKNGWEIEDVVKTPYKSRKKWSETDKDVFLLRDGKKIPYNEVE